ncbi:MAG: hypothetical protein SVV03_01015 [Candidatus Nanohaloarchaea archaeon]|nr:hypothetical protein [Candidatus Nanohaloarchaea archaeon]
MKLGSKILEGYLAVAIAILTVLTFFILSGTGFGETQNIFLGILIIILISVNILNSIITIRMLEQLKKEG